MTVARPPAVAGAFYPDDPDALRRAVDEAFAGAVALPEPAPVPKVLIVPHAGYVYSGAVAASGYRWITAARPTVRRVVLLGPSHRVYVRGIAVPSADVFSTPLGPVRIDAEARDRALTLPGVVLHDGAHRDEHSLEVQLPFLQTLLDDVAVLPMAVGDASQEQVAAVVEALWGGPETLIVVSTDLSHYHRYDVATERDAGTASVIVAMQPEAIEDDDACGARPLRGVLAVAAQHRLGAVLVDLRNSGDTAGDRKRVVGYGAFVVA